MWYLKKVNGSKPDFKVHNNEGEESVYIEVNTKQCNPKESIKIKTFREENFKNSSEHIKIRYTSYAPFGRTKNHVNIDAIRKIAQIKEDNYQIPREEIGVLWIDLQSEGINNIIDIKNASPLHYNKLYGMSSGVLWYSMYGKKGMSVFLSDLINSSNINIKEHKRLEFDGLLVQRKNDISAVVISADDYTVFFENPFCEKRIPFWFLENIINMPRFNYEFSKIRFPDYDLKRDIEESYERIYKLSQIQFIELWLIINDYIVLIKITIKKFTTVLTDLKGRVLVIIILVKKNKKVL